MAKAPATPASPFKIEFGAPPPAITRAGGGKTSVYSEVMKTMSPPDAKGKIAQFFVAATAPDSITDATERKAALKEEARKISNRISGTARRLTGTKDANDVEYAFAMRTQTDDAGNVGVRVYRVAATAPTTAPLPGKPPVS